MAAVRVHYEIVGAPSGPIVVLSHALGTSLALWDEQIEQLGETLSLVRYDLRGHGRSPAPKGPYSIADHGADLVALLDELDISHASVAGVSLGAMIAMWAAARQPARIERLALICTSAFLPPAEKWLQRARLVRQEGMDAIAGQVPQRWFTGAMASAQPEVFGRFERLIRQTDPEGYASSCEAIGTMDLRADLRRIAQRALVISGADDLATPPEHGQYIAENLVAGRHITLQRAAHLANVERSAEVTPLLIDHFAQDG